MTYIPLARKYRPGTFADLVGQTAAADALANAIRLGREPHAVIFTGVRGVGKTTCARLYAKALNCQEGPTPTPCNTCESCLAINLGTHEDVVEIDGASNTGVDDVRALRETVSYIPQRSKFKVYIIDEVHMLSQSAFNAMLKTLEEPPPHVVFVFATTELDRIPETIVSRCQLFSLKKFSLTEIEARLAKILTQEQIPFDSAALTIIAREGKGSMRDALTLLDYAIAMGDGKVGLETLTDILRSGSSSDYLILLEKLVRRDRVAVIQKLGELSNQGIEPSTIAEKIAHFARHGFILRDVGANHLDFQTLGYTDQERSELTNISKIAAPLDLNRIFRTFVKCRNDLDGSDLDQYVLENYSLEWCLDPGLPSGLQFLSQHSNQTSQPQVSSPAKSTVASTPPSLSKSFAQAVQKTEFKATPAQKPEPIPPPPSPKSEAPVAVASAATPFPTNWREFVDRWKQLKPLQARKLEEVHALHFSADQIELLIPAGSFASSSLLRPDEQAKLKAAFAELFQFKGQLLIRGESSTVLAAEKLPETLAQERQREQSLRRSQLEQELKDHPATREIVRLFDATIDKIELNELP